MTQSQQAEYSFSPEEIQTFEPMMKIGLVSTVTPEGYPHITLLSTLKAVNEKTLSWGQFTEGMSFSYVQQNPKVGWMVMTLNKDLWRGKGTFTHTEKSGADFDWYNNVPMFRYNAYFGIHTVYYMDLVEKTGKHYHGCIENDGRKSLLPKRTAAGPEYLDAIPFQQNG